MPILGWKMPQVKLLNSLFGLSLVCFGHCHQLDHVEENKAPSQAPQLALSQWQTIVTDRNQLRVAVKADSLVQPVQNGRSDFAGHVNVVFFDQKGDTASVLSAQRGSVDHGGQHIAVFGNVEIRSQDRTHLQTDSLRWDRDKGRILGDGSVSITRPDGEERGIGFDASEDLKQWTLREVQTQVTGGPQ